MGGIRELLYGKIWEWDLSFRWEWEWDRNGNEVIEMGGNWYEKSVHAHLYLRPPRWIYGSLLLRGRRGGNGRGREEKERA